MQELHRWDLTPEEAIQTQHALREQLILSWDDRPVTTVGGFDMSVREDCSRCALVMSRASRMRMVSRIYKPGEGSNGTSAKSNWVGIASVSGETSAASKVGAFPVPKVEGWTEL